MPDGRKKLKDRVRYIKTDKKVRERVREKRGEMKEKDKERKRKRLTDGEGRHISQM